MRSQPASRPGSRSSPGQRSQTLTGWPGRHLLASFSSSFCFTPERVGGMTSTPLVSRPICYALRVPFIYVTTTPSSTSTTERLPCPAEDPPPPAVRVPASHCRPRARRGHRFPFPVPCCLPLKHPRPTRSPGSRSGDPSTASRGRVLEIPTSSSLRTVPASAPGLAPAGLPSSRRGPGMSPPPGSPPRRAPPQPDLHCGQPAAGRDAGSPSRAPATRSY